MNRERFSTGTPWEPIVGYSRAIRAGDQVWVSGCTATTEGGRVEGDAAAQATQAIHNVLRALAALGATAAHVVRTRIYVTNIARDWEAVGRAHGAVFGQARPATSMVEVKALIEPWMNVEIEAEAVIR